MPLYLHHRYAVEAAASPLGGQNYIYAFRGDGRKPVEWVPAAAQQRGARRAAGDAEAVGAGAVARGAVEDPAAAGRLRPRRASCFRATRAAPSIRSSPAAVAADMTVGFMLTNDARARMVAQKAVDSDAAGLADVIDRLVAATFDAAGRAALRSRNQARRCSRSSSIG